LAGLPGFGFAGFGAAVGSSGNVSDGLRGLGGKRRLIAFGAGSPNSGPPSGGGAEAVDGEGVVGAPVARGGPEGVVGSTMIPVDAGGATGAVVGETGWTTGGAIGVVAGRELMTVTGGACPRPPMKVPPMTSPRTKAPPTIVIQPPSGSVIGLNSSPVDSADDAAAPDGAGICNAGIPAADPRVL
jgi:hypothetical protein